MPPTPLELFLVACGEHAVFIETGPFADAQNDFGLYTEEDVMDYIENLGIQALAARNVNPLDKPRWKPPPPPEETSVYAYNFWAGKKEVRRAYLAFFQSPLTGVWILKSFKMDPEAGANFVFRDVRLLEFRKALTLQKKDFGEGEK